MTIQAILFIVLIASFYGCLFHLITGGNVFSIFVDILISIAGFFAGHFMAFLIGRELIPLGVINFGWGTGGSILFLFIGGLISHPLF